MNRTIIGIAGGMGPQAGINLFNNIIKLTTAHTDQQHLPVVLMSFPGDIADRTDFLEGNEPVNPAIAIAEVIAKLETAGATAVGIACNTAHAPLIYNVIEEKLEEWKSNVKLVNMPFETCRYIREKHPQVKRVAVLSTNGTYRSGIYSNQLKEFGYEVIVPEYSFQNEVIHRAVYDPKFGLKANTAGISRRVQLLLQEALQYFKDRDAGAVILGCTELSMVLEEGYTEGMWIVDSAMSLARALVKETGTLPSPRYYSRVYTNKQDV